MITGERVVLVLLEVDLEDGALDGGGELLAAGRGGTDDAAAIQRFLRLLDALQAQALQSSGSVVDPGIFAEGNGCTKRKTLLGAMCYLPRCLLSSRRGLLLTISLRKSHRPSLMFALRHHQRPSLMFALRHHLRPSLMFSLRIHRRPFLAFSLRHNHRPLLT